MSLADDLKNLDPNKPGEWPLPVQMIVIAVLCAGIIYAGWHFDISNQRDSIASLKIMEEDLKGTFESKQKKAANLSALKDQMQEMQQSFGEMLSQLPNETEVPGLIRDVSQTGLAAGLDFDLWKPSGEKPSEFYAEYPIQISVKGNYHQLGEFISGIAALPRIVTTHNIKITKSDGSMLIMSATAKTYRALDEEE